MQKNIGPAQGFSLLELSVVVVILGLMLGGIMSAVTQNVRLAKAESLKMKMDAIEQALFSYAKKNGRLPCPADGTYVLTSAFFGVEAGVAAPGTGSCVSGASYDGDGVRYADTTPPNANRYYDTTVSGAVPVRALGLPDEYGFDPWGGRFTYAMDNVYSATNALTLYSPNSNIGRINIYDTGANLIQQNAVAVVISHGQNGHGAYLLSGSRKNAGSTNSNELINCHCTDSATDDTFSNQFVAGVATQSSSTDLRTSYDDITRYYTRGNFLANNDSRNEVK